MRRLFTLLLISMLPILAMGQNGTVYPIDLSVMMTPPYGTCLKEYVGSDRIVVQALLKDFSKKSDQFVVQLKVTDNRNRVVLLTNFGGYDFPAGKTFTYPMGPNADQGDKNNVLHQLFENAKIQPKNECFEEGAYTFEFQAFQAASYPSRKIALSMPFRYPVFLQGNTVQPLQIYPYENEVICSHAFEYTNENGIKRNATQLGGIAYQWQSANPTGMRVGYLLQVVDLGLIGDKKRSDIKSEAGGIFGRVDKESYRVNELTYAPFYNHAFSAGNYEENHAYAWRVLALVGKDLELGKNASVNDNNAPVRVFYFCGAPGIEKDDYEVIKDDREFDKNLHKVKMDTVKSTDLNALALWRDSSVKDAYCGVNVEIRKKGQEKWTPYFVEQTNKYDESIDPTDNSYTFTNLSYNTRYEVRAQYVKCENCAQRPTGCVYAPYSDILEFVIAQPIDSATCGDDLPKLADCGDGVKAPRILAGDTIIANGTKVVVDSVSYPNASDSSIISGKGHICMPIVKNIQLKMEFEEITINCAKELVKGKVVSVWDDKTCAMIDIDELGGQNSTGGTDNTVSDATVEEYDPSTANDKPAGTLMVDKDGTVKFKTKDGKIEDIGKSITLSAQEYQSKDFLSDNAHYIEFYNEDKNNAFDNNAQGYYDKISKYEYFDSPLNKVVLPWLANNPGKIKKIKAREVKKKETIASFESVMFVIPSGDSYIQLDAKQDKDGNYELQIPGWADVDYSTPIYAIARNSAESSYFDAGKMMQANYAERTHKLIIVPTKEEYSADVAKIQEQLNAIYGRVGVTYTVEEDRSFTNDEIVNIFLENGLDISADDESRWQVESGEMKLIRSMYEDSHPNMDKKAAYLFLVNQAEAPYESTEGDMPRNQSVGYIFMNNNKKLEDGRVVAHEIGHGVYKFQHTFDYGVEEKSTDNLMDYNNGDFLAHYQWRVMQDSVMFVWKVLQDDEDGQKIDLPTFNYNYKFQALDGKAFNKCLEYAQKIPFFNYCWNQLADDKDIYKIYVVAVTMQNLDYVISHKTETNGWFSRGEDKEESCWFFWSTKIPAGSEKNPHTINFIGPSAKESTEKMKSNGLASSSTMVEEVFHAAHTSYLMSRKSKDWFDNGSQFIQTEIEVVIMKNLIYFLYYNDLISGLDYKDLVPYVHYSILFNDGKYSETVHKLFKTLLTTDCNIKDVLWNSNKNPIDNFQKAISEKKKIKTYSSLDISKMEADMPFLNFLVSKYRNSLTKEVILNKINAAEEKRKKAAEEKKKKAAEEKKKNMSNSNKSKK